MAMADTKLDRRQQGHLINENKELSDKAVRSALRVQPVL